MSTDALGRQFLTEDEMLVLMHRNPEIDLSNILMVEPEVFNSANQSLYSGFPKIKKYISRDISIEEFDSENQEEWMMPEQYKNMDIMTWLVNQATTDAQVNRIAEELVLYEERDLIQLLRFLKYMIDTFRKNKIVWGVGRGSSVASYVLFILGVHKIDSMKFDLDIKEFLR